MNMQVHYHNLENSPWMDQFIENRVARLNKYLSPSASILVNLRFENRNYVSSIAIHTFHNDYAFTANGSNLYESFSLAIEKAMRSLAEHKRMVKDRIHRQYSSMKYDLTA